MNVNVIFLCTTVGALVGTIVGILLMNRKVRLPITGADLAALRSKVQAAEAALADAKSTVDDLRKQLAEREQALQQHTEESKKKQAQLTQILAEVEKDKLQRSVTEQIGQELSTQNASLLKSRSDLEAKLEQERALANERSTQIATLQAQLESEKQQVRELTAQAERLAADGVALSRSFEQERRQRASVEAELSSEQERVRQLTDHVTELELDRSQLSRKLHEERESAERGMELLRMAQENFSRVTDPVHGELRRGEIVELPIEPRPVAESAGEQLNGVQSAMSVD